MKCYQLQWHHSDLLRLDSSDGSSSSLRHRLGDDEKKRKEVENKKKVDVHHVMYILEI